MGGAISLQVTNAIAVGEGGTIAFEGKMGRSVGGTDGRCDRVMTVEWDRLKERVRSRRWIEA